MGVGSSQGRWPPLFSPVMATGIVSLAGRGAGWTALSEVLLWLSAALYVVLLAYHAARFARRPAIVLAELRTSAIFDYLTFVAAGALLGGSLLLVGVGPAAAWVLLGLSGSAWLAIVATIVVELLVIRSLHPRAEAQGGWLLAVVAPQALALLCLGLAGEAGGLALRDAAAVLWVLGSALYLPIALERLSRLRRSGRRLSAGLRAEDWIGLGALAISALAGSELLEQLGPFAGLGPCIRVLVSAQLACAWALLPLLVWGEVRHALTPAGARSPSGSRWATVFPLGMLSVSSRDFAPAHGWLLSAGADLSFAVALAAWLVAALVAVG
jgi:tellurite resistance protein TehA-like permease